MQLDVDTDDAFRSFLPGAAQEDDRALIIDFFVQKKLMGFKSHEAKREIYEDREFIRIRIKGQDKQEVVEEVKEHHRNKYPIAYQLFLMRKPAPVVGTPVEQLPGVGPSLAHHLKGLGLRSVEDVANVGENDAVLQNIGMGARELRDRAKAWLANTTDATVALQAQLAAEREARQASEAAREREREEFEARLKALEGGRAAPKRRKARRAKPATEPAQESSQ